MHINTKVLLGVTILIVIMVVAVLWNTESFQSSQRLIDDITHAPGTSYYNTLKKEDYGESAIFVVYHYTNWCSYCKAMRPIWENVRARISDDPNFSAVTFDEHNEDEGKTPGVNTYPTIIKYHKGSASIYPGIAAEEQLYKWILNPITVDTYGF